LAGSCPRGATPAQDAQLAAALLADPKSQQENYWVEQDICTQLGNITHTQHIEPLHTITLPTVQHLKRTITGTLQLGITDAALIARLHPTPAVGGLPRSEALAFIANQEPFCRGYYAGAFGQLSHQHSEVCVSIRSAVFTPTTITLWTGAGILTGSDPATEWQELQDKSRHLLALILGDPHA
jgi:menaquinone-specific isochorismate synthase